MTVLVDIVNAINNSAQDVYNFFHGGLYELLTKWTAWFIRWFVVGMFKAKIAALTFAYDVAQELITSMNLSAYLNNAYASLESRTLAALTFFRIPEAINIIISASVTKFVFRFLGF